MRTLERFFFWGWRHPVALYFALVIPTVAITLALRHLDTL